MKSIVCTSLLVMVLVSAHRFAGTSNSTDKKSASITVKNTVLKFDTFYAVRIIRRNDPSKTVARDTVVLVMQEMPGDPPSKKAANKYRFEFIPFSPFDTTGIVKTVEKDTLIWTSKPYRP